jgi:hypothetical protein
MNLKANTVANGTMFVQNAFEILNITRLASSGDFYGFGLLPGSVENALVILFTSGVNLDLNQLSNASLMHSKELTQGIRRYDQSFIVCLFNQLKQYSFDTLVLPISNYSSVMQAFEAIQSTFYRNNARFFAYIDFNVNGKILNSLAYGQENKDIEWPLPEPFKTNLESHTVRPAIPCYKAEPSNVEIPLNIPHDLYILNMKGTLPEEQYIVSVEYDNTSHNFGFIRKMDSDYHMYVYPFDCLDFFKIISENRDPNNAWNQYLDNIPFYYYMYVKDALKKLNISFGVLDKATRRVRLSKQLTIYYKSIAAKVRNNISVYFSAGFLWMNSSSANQKQIL